MNTTRVNPEIASTAASENRHRYWLATWLARRPDVMSRLIAHYHRLQRWSRARRRRLTQSAAVTVAGAALLLALASAPAKEEAITVVYGEVAVLANGKCSLIEAINNANDTKTGLPHKDCAAGNPSGADTINLPKDGKFLLVEAVVSGDVGSSGTPWISSTITINGYGSVIERDTKSPRFRIMQVGRKGDLTLTDITIRRGESDSEWYGGSGLYVQGQAKLTQVTVSDNLLKSPNAAGGGILNKGSLVMTDSVVSRNRAVSGGGINNDGGNLDLIRSSIVSNTAVAEEEEFAGFAGGIGNEHGGRLYMLDSTVEENRAVGGFAGGVLNVRGTVTIVASVISRNMISGNFAYGGGIMNGDVLILKDSTLSNNSANAQRRGRGGGIYNDGYATVTGSTFVGNSVRTADPSFRYSTVGGGVSSPHYGLKINDSTFSDNYAPMFGGGIANGRNANLTNVTISHNDGGGVFTYCANGTTWLARSVVSGNTPNEALVDTPSDCAGAMIVDSHNLLGVSGNSGVNFPIGASDIVPSIGLGSILAPLADNGGPTWTHALVPGSPAIDHAPSIACAGQTDQRGFVRNANGDGQPSSNECDIGAFEFSGNLFPPTPSVTPTGTPKPPNTPTPTASPTGYPAPSPTPTRTPIFDWRSFIPFLTRPEAWIP